MKDVFNHVIDDLANQLIIGGFVILVIGISIGASVTYWVMS